MKGYKKMDFEERLTKITHMYNEKIDGLKKLKNVRKCLIEQWK